ncbi:hypothetical protein H2200_011243 [Cladophialophora chaetospira]|uniref:Uncharacterized protein n=1 Tax=Cladophialophora chaetospira TaxID=386627 RepID=A0AA38X094_9EURO|nr:hypothetical protein H2200_011243 [Cladophialophora chaetospira]
MENLDTIKEMKRQLTEGPVTRARVRQIAELEEREAELEEREAELEELQAQRANAQLAHELQVEADEAEDADLELSRSAEMQLKRELQAFADEEQRQRELELQRKRQAKAAEEQRQREIVAAWNGSADQYRATRESWKIASWVSLGLGLCAIVAILRGALINYNAETKATKVENRERICKSLENTASQMFEVGSVMGELLPSANYLKDVSNHFEPQLRLLAPAEINFSNKTRYLRNLKAYGEGLDKAGRNLSDTILQIERRMWPMSQHINEAIISLEAVYGMPPSFWSSEPDSTGDIVTDVFHSIDINVELFTKLINENIHHLNRTDQHRLAYLEQYLEVRDSLQAAIDERGYMHGSSPLHQAMESVMYLKYPTEDILAVLKCSYYRLTLLQPQLWPNRRSRQSLYEQGYTAISHDSLPAILDSLRKAKNALDLISSALKHIAAVQEKFYQQLPLPAGLGGGGTIPIPHIWDDLHWAANEARQEFPGIERGPHHANDESG